MHLVAGCVMESSMMFCQKNILWHSMRFHGDYIKGCLLTTMVSHILYLTQLISEIKNFINCCKQTFLYTFTIKGLKPAGGKRLEKTAKSDIAKREKSSTWVACCGLTVPRMALTRNLSSTPT